MINRSAMQHHSHFGLFVPYVMLYCLVTGIFVSGGCIDSWRTRGSRGVQKSDAPIESGNSSEMYHYSQEDAPDAGSEIDSDSDASTVSAAELEEYEMEDPFALAALIAAKIGKQKSPDYRGEHSSVGRNFPQRDLLPAIVPTGEEIMKLTSAQCLKQLARHKVPFKKTDFETPLVETPVLLTGPVGKVRIEPLYSGKTPTHSVMDCRLVLALVEMAHHVEALGVNAVEFYSTYRPLAKPPATCSTGSAGKQCRAKQAQFERIKAAQTSQHRFARAIDIGRFRMENGETLDVLGDFDRRSGKDPCSYTPSSEKAALLADIVCGLHAHHIFQVMLTPNANKAHHNHFHFDLTPNVSWYIVR